MAEDKKEKWMNYMAITTVIIAVCATFSTFRGGGYSTKSLMNQTLASDQWAQFQAKSIKSYIFEMQKDNLDLQKDMLPKSGTEKISDKYQTRIDNYGRSILKYKNDKDSITRVARSFEAQVKVCKRHSDAFGIAVIFLQISILLSSISALAKKHYIYYFSLVVGVIGVLYFLDGFFLFLK